MKTKLYMVRLVVGTLLALWIEIGYADALDNWTLRYQSRAFPLSAVIYTNAQFVAVGGGTILTSADGLNWVQRQSGIHDYLSGVAYGDGQFVAVGGDWNGHGMATVTLCSRAHEEFSGIQRHRLIGTLAKHHWRRAHALIGRAGGHRLHDPDLH